jgi:alpha-glucosidase (family GH31 glycosyl hydrolase)
MGAASVKLETDAASVTVTCTGGAVERIFESPDCTRLRASGAGPLLISFSLQPDEDLAGLGECFGLVRQRGRRWHGRIIDLLHGDPQDTYFHFPLLYSSLGYAVLVDTPLAPIWDLGVREPDRWQVELATSSVDLHVFRGQPKRCLQLATAVTGRPPLPPRWALGVWKTTLGGTESVLRHADRLGEQDLPVTACWVYDHYDEATNSGCGAAGAYPTGPYPDLETLTHGLHDRGYRALGYVQPGIYFDSQPYHEGVEQGYLVSDRRGEPLAVPYFNPKRHPDEMGSFPDGAAPVDLTNPAAADWYRGLLQATMAQGWDGWMQDMGEHVPPEAVLADGTSGEDSRNRYALLYHGTAAEAFAGHEDFTVFARSGTLGTVPLVTAMWPGDQACSWSADRGLPSVLTAGPTAGLTGVSTWGPDISGLTDGDDGFGGRDEELWLRWCEYGALNPIMRDHLGFKVFDGAPVDLWSTGRTRATFRRYADLHLRLAPYLWRLAGSAHETGIPAIRALLLEYPEYRESWSITDEYLLGEDLLVAPVHQRGATSRAVWFPPGEWASWWRADRHTGPGWHDVAAPLGEVPLFQRVGSSIPLARRVDPRLEPETMDDVEIHAVM